MTQLIEKEQQSKLSHDRHLLKGQVGKNFDRPIHALDLFAGAGGLSLGFKWAGFPSNVKVEFDPSCFEILSRNFPEANILEKDIHKVDSGEVRDAFGISEKDDVDFIIGGPPCQGFSLIGLRDPNDPRSGLVFEYGRMISEIKPKFFVMENVPGMLSTLKGEFVKQLVEIFKSFGYQIYGPKVLNSADFGVPQNRQRVFIVGVRNDIDFEYKFPQATHINPRSLDSSSDTLITDKPIGTRAWEAICDLPDIEKHESLIESEIIAYDKSPMSEYSNLMRGYENSFLRDLVLPVPADWTGEMCSGCRRTIHGDVLKNRFSETGHGETVEISRLYKIDPNDVSNTLRAGTPRERGAYSSPRPVHPYENRVLSVREGARLQSFPDWHVFHHTKWHGFRQVGNAVPPLLAYHVAKMFHGFYEEA